MRVLLLFGFFLGCLFFYRNQEEAHERDVVSTRSSAIRKALPVAKGERHVPKIATLVTHEDSPSATDYESNSQDEDFQEDTGFKISWNEIEEGWRTELKALLTELDPENGEKIYEAYVEESKKYTARVEESFDTAQGAQMDGMTPIVEYDSKAEQSEAQHLENLKEIFGPHYKAVESLHQEYVESIQHLNTSDVKLTFTL